MGDIKVFLQVWVGMGNFPSNIRGMGGFGLSLTGNFGAGSKILPREGLNSRMIGQICQNNSRWQEKNMLSTFWKNWLHLQDA